MCSTHPNPRIQTLTLILTLILTPILPSTYPGLHEKAKKEKTRRNQQKNDIKKVIQNMSEPQLRKKKIRSVTTHPLPLLLPYHNDRFSSTHIILLPTTHLTYHACKHLPPITPSTNHTFHQSPTINHTFHQSPTILVACMTTAVSAGSGNS